MTVIVNMVQKDTHPVIEAVLKRRDETVVDLTGCTVRFHLMKNKVTLIDKPAEIIAATEGKVRFVWAVGDTDYVGLCKAEFEVTFADGKVLTFPSREEFFIHFRGEYG